MRNTVIMNSLTSSYPLPVLVRVLFNLLIFKGKILYYNKYSCFLSNRFLLVDILFGILK